MQRIVGLVGKQHTNTRRSHLADRDLLLVHACGFPHARLHRPKSALSLERKNYRSPAPRRKDPRMRVLPIEDDGMIGTADRLALKGRGLRDRLSDQREPAVHPAESKACKFALLHLGLAKIHGQDVFRAPPRAKPQAPTHRRDRTGLRRRLDRRNRSRPSVF